MNVNLTSHALLFLTNQARESAILANKPQEKSIYDLALRNN
jgi:hypothetical protein